MRKTITWKNFKVGDIIITLGGEQCKVLGTLGEIIVCSGWWIFDTYGKILTIKDAEKKGWRFIQPDGSIPMKQDEVDRFFTKKIKIIK